MEIKKEIIDGVEIEYASDISFEEIERNDDDLFGDTIDVSEIVSEVNKNISGDTSENK